MLTSLPDGPIPNSMAMNAFDSLPELNVPISRPSIERAAGATVINSVQAPAAQFAPPPVSVTPVLFAGDVFSGVVVSRLTAVAPGSRHSLLQYRMRWRRWSERE